MNYIDKSFVILAAVVGLVPAAFAQAAPDADAPDPDQARRLGAIVVTSQKREESLLEVPASVGIITADAVEKGFLVETADLVRLDSSLTVGGGRVRIRGVGTDAFDVAAEPSVSFAIDGVVLGRTGQAFLDLVDIERVEVLRGPQGTLYGKNVSAGLVNIITRDPSANWEGDLELIAAEHDEYQGKGAISGPLGDRVRVRLSGTYKDLGDFMSNPIVGEQTNGQIDWNTRGKFAVDFTEQFRGVLTAYTRRRETNGPDETFRRVTDPVIATIIAPVTASPSNRRVTTDGTSFNKVEEDGVIANLSFDLAEGHKLESISSWISTQTRAKDDVDARPETSAVYSGGITGLGLAGPIILTQIADQKIEQYSQEFRITSPEGPFQYVAGLYGFKLELDDVLKREFDACLPTGLNTLPAIPPGSPCFDPRILIGGSPGILPFSIAVAPGRAQVNRIVETETYAAFGQADWQSSDRVTLTGGLRVQADKTSFRVSQPFPSLPPLGFGLNVGPTTGSNRSNAVSGKVAIRWDYADTANVYASYAKGYKAPTASLRGNQVGQVDAETSNAYEIGWKSESHDGRLFVQLAGFWTDFEDFQTETFNPAAASFVLANAGKTRSRGVEGSFVANPTDHWTIFGGVSYTEAKIREFRTGQCFSPTFLDPACVTRIVTGPSGPIPFQSKDLSGGDLPNSPDWKFNINARYEAPAGPKFKVFGQAGYVWQDDVQFDLSQNPNTIQESYGVLDVSAGFGPSDDAYLFSIFVRNVLDEAYNNFIFQDFVQRDSVNLLQFFDKRSERYAGVSLRFKLR